MEENRLNRINLKDLYLIAIGKWPLLLILISLGIIISFIYSYFFATPLYDSTGKIYIINKDKNLSTSEITISTNLTKDYENLIVDTAVLGVVSNELGEDFPLSRIRGSVSVHNPKDTRFIEITARTENPEDSKKIVDAVCAVAQEKITELLGMERVKIVRAGNVAKNPSVPNTTRNMAVGAFIGFSAFVAVLFIIYLLDDKINSPEDVEKYLGLSVLGNIPFNQTRAKSK